jgi:hypothetical protein
LGAEVVPTACAPTEDGVSPLRLRVRIGRCQATLSATAASATRSPAAVRFRQESAPMAEPEGPPPGTRRHGLGRHQSEPVVDVILPGIRQRARYGKCEIGLVGTATRAHSQPLESSTGRASAGIVGTAESTVPESTAKEVPSGKNACLAGRTRGNRRAGPHLLGERASSISIASQQVTAECPTEKGATLAIERRNDPDRARHREGPRRVSSNLLAGNRSLIR